MTREEKIRAIEDIKTGIPAHIALNRDKYKWLSRNQSEDFFWTSEGQKVSKEEQEKYFPDSIISVNVSKQYKIGGNGKIQFWEEF
jgi:hypothetical protein